MSTAAGTVTKIPATSHAVADGNTSYSYASQTDNRRWMAEYEGRTARFATKRSAQAWLDMKNILAQRKTGA